MESLDEILAKWRTDLEAFPEAMWTRQETGCCFSPVAEARRGPHVPPAGNKPK